MEVYCIGMSTNNIMSQVELNKTIINRYFEAYNSRNEAIFDEIIDREYVDHGQSAYMELLEKGLRERRMISDIP